jgi:hypothetical protein
VIAQTYSAIIAVSVAVGFWFGKALSANGPQKPKESAALSDEDSKDDCKLVNIGLLEFLWTLSFVFNLQALVVLMDLGMNKGKIAAQ